MTQKIMTKDELWQWQVPSFNFELGRDELLEKALKVGFVTFFGYDEDGETTYLVNSEYNKVVA